MARTKIDTKTAERFAKAQALADRARDEFRKHNSFYEVWAGLDGTVGVEIHWGDWKHDHLFVDHILAQLGAKYYSTDVTEENGSDTYSAIHRYIAN